MPCSPPTTMALGEQNEHRPIAAVSFLLGLSFVTLLAPATSAQDPNRPIRFIVGFPPGGSVDVLARAVANQATKTLGQPGLGRELRRRQHQRGVGLRRERTPGRLYRAGGERQHRHQRKPIQECFV